MPAEVSECTQQALPIDWVETLVEDHYERVHITADRAEQLRTYLQAALSARRADAELERRQQQARLASLTAQSRKLLEAHYNDAIPLDLLKSEQDRIAADLDAARHRIEATAQVFADIEESLDAALGLARNCASAYRSAAPHLRRQLNQALFERLLVDDETVESDMAAPFGLLLGQDLAVDARSFATRPHTTGRKNEEPAIPEGDGGWVIPGHADGTSLSVDRLVGVTGLEPVTSRV